MANVRKSYLRREVLLGCIFIISILLPMVARGEQRIKRFDVIDLEVSDVKWVYLKFKSDISNIDHGTDDIEIQRTNIPSIAKVRSFMPFFNETHATFITKDGAVHTFHLHYKISPSVSAVCIEGGAIEPKDIIAPMQIELSDERTSHITFPKKVLELSVGCDSAIVDHVPNTDNMVMAKCYPYDTTLFKATSLTVVTEDKQIYAFDVTYKSDPSILNFSVDEADKVGALFSAISVNETDMNRLGEEVLAKGALLNRGVVDGKMLFALQSIYIKGDVVMFHFAISNQSQIDYDIDFVKCYITNRKNMKKQALQAEEIPPLYEYVPASHRLSFVPALGSYHFVLFYKRFTIPDKHNLFFELFEKNGGRHLQFSVTNRDLLGAKVLK